MTEDIHGNSTAAGPTVVPKLQILQGDPPGKSYNLKFKSRIGRESDNDVVITDPRISRYHFQISYEDGKWLLSDLGSVNGTFINGMVVNVAQPLTHGDQIALGETILAFIDPVIEKDAPIDPTAPLLKPKATGQRDSLLGNRRTLAWIVGGLLLILILAVIGLTWLSRNRGNESTEIATPTSAVAIIRTEPDPASNLELKFEDDFTDSFGGWDDAFDKNYTKQYGNNRYHIEITTNDLVVWGLANRIADDFEVEVEALQEDGGRDNTYGMIFRYVDHDNYYRFDISGDGYYLLSKFEAGEWYTLADWTSSAAIHQEPGAINVLKVSASGPEIAIFANGEELARVEDEAFAKGNFGFFASTFADMHMWVSFDNLKLWGPPDSQLVQIFTTTSSGRPPAGAVVAEAAETGQNTTGVGAASALTPTPTVAEAAVALKEATATPEETAEITATVTITTTAEEGARTSGIEVPVEDTPTPEPTATPVPLPEFVSRDQPLARGEQALSGKIYFPVFDQGRGTYDIYRANPDGTERELIQRDASQPALDSSGEVIAYRSWKADERGLITRRLDTTDHWIFVRFFEAASPIFSNDDQYFIFHSREGGEIPAIYRTFGTDHQVLRRDSIPIQGEMVALTPEGRIIYRGCMANSCGLISSNLDGSFPQQLTDYADDTAPNVSPDGKTVAFMSNRGGNWDVYAIDIDGQNFRQLTDDEGSDGLPAWSPDGDLIAFITNRDGNWAMWSMTANGQQRRQLFLLGGSIDGVVQIDIAHAFGWLEERIVWAN